MWNTSNVTSLFRTFSGCSGLTIVNGLSDWDISKVTDLRYTFSGCSKLTSLDLSNWDTSAVRSMNDTFSGCKSLRELALSSTFSFKSKSLPEHSSTSEYTAYWVKDDALEGPAYTSSQMQNLSGADLAGTWVWQPVQTKYYIEFDGNGASGCMARILADAGKEYVLPECAYYQLYQEFAGWSLDKDGSSGLMEAGSSQILSEEGQATVPLYAQWKAAEYDAELDEGWYTFQLKGDEQAVFENLPTEGSYSIYEQTEDGWVLADSSNTSGSILPNDTSKATFTNRQTEDASAQLIASKTVDGETPDAAFTFELIDENGSVVSSVSNAEDGTILFPVQTYSAEGEYNYTIREVNDHQDGYEYDNSTFAATVTVTKNEDGNLVSSVSYDQTPVFNNTRIVQYGTLTVSKTVENGDSDQDFTFQINLYDEDGRVYSGSSTGTAYLGDKLESISFGYEFTLKDGGSVLFTLPDGIRYEVVETDIPTGYTCTSEGAVGRIVSGEKASATFTNTYSNPYTNNPATAIIQASKVLEGAELEDGEFAFELEGNGETYTATNTLDGMVSFELTFDEAGTYKYTLKEATGDSDDIEYDDSEYGVTVTVSESGSRLIASVSYDSTPVFTNVMKPGNLSITVIAQDVPDSLKEEEFSFVLHLTDENGNALSGEYAVQGTDKTVCDGDTIALKNGEVLILENIPAGTQYSFGQTDLNDGWTLSESQNSNGSIVSNQTAEAKFVFVYAPESTTLTFEASKILMEEGEEKDLTAGQFTFELLDEEGNVLSSAVNDESGNIVFDEIVYTAADVGSTFVYQVLEMDDRQEYITYDSTVYTRTVIVSAESGKVTYAIKETDSIVFENTYAYTASGSVKLSGHKTLEGAELQAGQFEFEVLENGSVVSTGLNTASGDISFDTIVYGVSDVGEHTYTVREVKNVLDLFTEYDDSSYSVSVAVSDNGDGTLTCYVSGDDDLSFENVHRGLTVPFAGEIGIGFGLGFGVVLLVGSAYLIWKKD
jgi:pilin isopeptide linkage protein